MSQEVIESPTEEFLEKEMREFCLNERRVREAVEYLKCWIQLQPHLPKEIGEKDKDTLQSTTPVQLYKDNFHSTTPVQLCKGTLLNTTPVQL